MNKNKITADTIVIGEEESFSLLDKREQNIILNRFCFAPAF
jgi:hypothetical protein